jgi:3'-5' exonuclease
VLKTPPVLKYNGLTIILSNPSRFDKVSLLSAGGGLVMNDFCLKPEFNIMQCDIRLTEDTTPFLPQTKCALLLGEKAMHDWCPDSRQNTLNELRGSPLTIRDNLPAYASFIAQDCADIKNYEKDHNPFSSDFQEDDSERDDDGDDSDTKVFGKTKRANYAFWLRRDVWKCKQVLSGKQFEHRRAEYKIYPSSDEVINILTRTKGRWLDFDIETDYEEQNLLCFSFSFDGVNVFCVPVLNHEYQWAYSALPKILRALIIAFRDNIVVAHNGKSFDFPVLARKYKIPINRAFDTMICMNRIFPDIEKSLGHIVSYWTNERFHKDTDSKAYRTREHMMSKLLYCGKDVFTMGLCREAMLTYSKTIPGLESSIKCAMESIRPYIICELQGIYYSQEKLEQTKKENDRLMMQYLRMIKILIGETTWEECRSQVKSKDARGTICSSNTQSTYYFHTLLDYSIVARSPKTGKPSLGKVAMYKLALQHPDNLVIRIILAYRILAKEYGSLKFMPWKDENNTITKPNNTQEETSGFARNLQTLNKGSIFAFD